MESDNKPRRVTTPDEKRAHADDLTELSNALESLDLPTLAHDADVRARNLYRKAREQSSGQTPNEEE